MHKSQILALYDEDQRRTVEYPQMRREVTPQVVRLVNLSDSGEGAIVYSHLSKADVEEAIREQVSYFEGIGQDFEWKYYDHDAPPDLKERLRAYGFVVEEAEAIMVLDLAEAPAVLTEPAPPNVKRILDPGELSDVMTVEEQVWGEDFSSLGDYLREALTNYPAQMSVYVAYIGEKPASTAWIYFPAHSQFASLWGGSTLDGFRKQGLYTALLAVRTQEARGRGVRYLTVDASPMSRPILEKFGFQLMCNSYPCKWHLRHGRSGAAA